MKRHSILVLTLVLLATGARAETWSDTTFVGDVSTSGWAAVSGAAVAITNGGYYTNVAVVQTNYYRLSATNVAGRLPGSTNIVAAWTPHSTLSNAVALSWTRHGGILRHVVEKSYNAGSTWTNWLTLGPGVSTWTDTGSNTWTASVFTNVVPTLIPAGTLPWRAQSAEGIVFSETADDNMGLESVTYAIGNSQTSGVWMGYAALYAAPGSQNAAVGGYGLYQATGSYNSVVGYQAGYQSTGSYNAAVGNASLYQSSGTRNSAMGMNALVLAPGSYNAAMGNSALRLSPGDYNSALGYQAGNQAGGVSNVYLGAKAGNAAGAMTNAIAIGAGAVPLGDNSAVLGNSATVTTEIKGTRLITGGTTFLYYASSTNYVAMWADQSAYYIQAVSNGAAGVGVVRTNALFP